MDWKEVGSDCAWVERRGPGSWQVWRDGEVGSIPRSVCRPVSGLSWEEAEALIEPGWGRTCGWLFPWRVLRRTRFWKLESVVEQLTSKAIADADGPRQQGQQQQQQ